MLISPMIEAAIEGGGRALAGTISRVLDPLGPAAGVRADLGYTLQVPLLHLFTPTEDGWGVDRARVRDVLSCLERVERSAVLHLNSTHFSFAGQQFAAELYRDPANVLFDEHGPLAEELYFLSKIHSWTLNLDAPVHAARRAAIRVVLEELAQMAPEAQARVTAVTLLGEVHHLFGDLQHNGAGVVREHRYTDRSPAAELAYRVHAGAAPPQRIVTGAGGRLPVYGWSSRRGCVLYVDGALFARTEDDLSRTDVFDALPELGHPNVGWRHDLDLSRLGGVHLLQAVVDGREVGRTVLTVGGAATPAASAFTAGAFLPLDFPAHQDFPGGDYQVDVDPAVTRWLAYRQEEVALVLKHYAALAAACGVPAEKIFSHQIIPQTYGSWSYDLLATEGSLVGNSWYRPGITLYGGSTYNDQLPRLQKQYGWTGYGVGEINPLSEPPGGYEEMLLQHRRQGCVYLSPYFMTGQEARNAHSNKFVIEPGSAYYEAIRALVNG